MNPKTLSVKHPHPNADELKGFLEETIDAGAKERISSHLQECGRCQNQIEKLVGSPFNNKNKVVGGDSSNSTHKFSDAKTKGPDDPPAIDPESIDFRFMILDELARGGMGAIYRGFDRDFKREVAIKIAHSTSGAANIRFHREAQISGQLQHPGIVPVHHTGQLKDGRHFIAMKLVKGRTLSSVIHDPNDTQPTRLFNIFNDICNTLAYSHSRGIIHRDLKPENIMVGAFGEVQIMDWGLARKLSGHTHAGSDSEAHDKSSKLLNPGSCANEPEFKPTPGSTQPGDIFGTPAYMSPEQARGDKSDKRTDVFALGGILFEILTGKPPFDAPTASVALQQSVASDLAIAFHRLDESNADAGLILLAKNCLAAKPDDRPADAQAVSLRFGDYLAGREQQFEENRLEKARATERLLAQQKRIRQLLISCGIILATLLASALAGYMYLTERNTRLANEAVEQRNAFELKIRQESQIQSSIDTAAKHATASKDRVPHEQHIDWTLALKEIEKSVPLISDSITPGLRTKFVALESTVRSARAAALRRKASHELEAKCAEDLFPLREHVYYPEDMRLCNWVNLLPEFEAIFARLGLKPGTISHDSIDRIANSVFKTQLVHGLMVWHGQTEIHSSYDDLKSDDRSAIIATSRWLDKLIKLVDPDPMRIKLRERGHNLMNEKLALIESEAGVSSLLTVYAAASALNVHGVSENDQIAYLLRAHEKFPNDFFVNWWQPVMTSSEKATENYALACYSIRPDNPAVLIALGNAFLNDNKPFQAIKPLERLTRVAPWYYLGHKNLGLAYGKTGQFKKAEAQLELANEAMEAALQRFEDRLKFYRKSGRKEKTRTFERFLEKNKRSKITKREPPVDSPSPLSAKIIEAQEQIENRIAAKKKKITSLPDYPAHYGSLRTHYSELCKLLRNAKRPDLVSEAVDRAIADFQEAAQLTEIPAPHENLSILCEEHGRLDIAIESLRHAILAVPEYDPHKDRLIVLHQNYCNQASFNSRPGELIKAIDGALQDMRRFSDESTNGGDHFHKQLATFAEKYRRFEDAIVGYQRAMAAVPRYHHWRIKLGEMHIALGQTYKQRGQEPQAKAAFDKAIDLFQEWATSEPENKTPHERLCGAFEQAGRYAEAMNHLKIAIGVVPAYVPHHNYYAELAVSLCRQQEKTDPRESTRTLELAIEFLSQFGPKNERLTDLYVNLSRLQGEAKLFKAAIQSLSFAIDKNPGDLLLRERLGHLHVGANQPDLAEPVFESLVKENPDSLQAITAMARFLARHDKLDQAKKLIVDSRARGITSSELEALLSQASRK